MSEFKCLPCGKVYPNKALLTRHLTSAGHTGIRLGCPHCSVTFSRSDTLKAHVKGAHAHLLGENGRVTGGVVWKQPQRQSSKQEELDGMDEEEEIEEEVPEETSGRKRRASEIWAEPPAILEIFDEEEDQEEEEIEGDENEENQEIEPEKEANEEMEGIKEEEEGVSKKQVECLYCQRTFGNSGALGFHVKVKHYADYRKKQRENKLKMRKTN